MSGFLVTYGPEDPEMRCTSCPRTTRIVGVPEPRPEDFEQARRSHVCGSSEGWDVEDR